MSEVSQSWPEDHAAAAPAEGTPAVPAPEEPHANAPAEDSVPDPEQHAEDNVVSAEPDAVDVTDVTSEPVVHEDEAAVAALGQAHAEIQANIEDKAYEPAEADVEDGSEVILKPVSGPGEAALVRAGEARISRVLLAEIDQRRSLDDIGVLIAAVAGLLDEVETSG